MKHIYPQILLLGNGLNRAYNADSWSKILTAICSNDKVNTDSDDFKRLPCPLQAVLATDDHITESLKKKPDIFYGVENIDEIRPQIQKLLDIEFDHILTTNYSYEIERSVNNKM